MREKILRFLFNQSCSYKYMSKVTIKQKFAHWLLGKLK